MKPSNVCLLKQEIPRLLSGVLPPDETSAAEQHIAVCETCRSVIESMIADSCWWDDARYSLESWSTRSANRTDGVGEAESTTTQQILDLLGPTEDPAMQGRIGVYEIVGILGRGGMGVVFKGYDRSLNRYVAIKMLLPHLAAAGAARKRFAREAQAAAAVVDDHVMAIHGVSEWKSVPYFVMPYARGVSLQKRLSKDGPLQVREILRIGMQAAKGLAAAHAQGLVHRDVKPANIFLDEGVERVQLMDFGLARAVDDASLTRSGTLAGTPQYMSPEQARAEAVDHRSDLFSLGSVLYAMCTGHAPFCAESSYSVLRLITDKEPRPIGEITPDIPEWLCAIISKLMSKQTVDRFESAEQVAELLEACLAHVQNPTTIPLPKMPAPASGSAAFPKQTTGLRPFGVRTLIPQASAFGTRARNVRRLVTGVLAFGLMVAAVVLVLKSDHGTLTIESELDDVPIRITQGDAVVRRLTVGRSGSSTRLHAGQYTIEIDSPDTHYDVMDAKVVVRRGQAEIARIRYQPADAADSIPLTDERPLDSALREFNHLHPADANGKPQPPLTQSEVIAKLLWLTGEGQLSDEAVLAIQPILYTRDRLVPAGWRFTGGFIYQRSNLGAIQTWQVNLDTNGLTKPILIRRTAIAPPPLLREPSKETNDEDAAVSLADAIDAFNKSQREIERSGALPYQPAPLTQDEVLAAIALWQTERNAADLDDATLERVQRIARTHRLSPQIRFERAPSIESSIGQWFHMDSIRMLIPRADAPDSTYAFTIRQQFVELDRNNLAATHWGLPGENGIQAGVRLVPAQHTYERGQVVDIEFLYRSVTSEQVPATLPRLFQFGKVSGIRFERISFVQPKWPDGSVRTMIGNKPIAVRGHRMQICFEGDTELKDGVNLKAITRPQANHYVRFVVPNPGDDAANELLEMNDRLFFCIQSLTPPQVLPEFAGHYYQHWGSHIPGHEAPKKSTPDPEYVDPFQIGVSLGAADKSRIPAYFASGLRVTRVAPYSPAEYAGIEVGDILLSWEGNQIHGNDPAKPFANYSNPNNQLREALQKNATSRGWDTFNMQFDLLDHRTGEVIRIAPWFGSTAGGGPNKGEVIKRMNERKRLRQQP